MTWHFILMVFWNSIEWCLHLIQVLLVQVGTPHVSDYLKWYYYHFISVCSFHCQDKGDKLHPRNGTKSELLSLHYNQDYCIDLQNKWAVRWIERVAWAPKNRLIYVTSRLTVETGGTTIALQTAIYAHAPSIVTSRHVFRPIGDEKTMEQTWRGATRRASPRRVLVTKPLYHEMFSWLWHESVTK